MTDLWALGAVELAGLIRGREVSAREAAVAALARLDAVNPAVNAVVDWRPEDVLRQAGEVDAALAAGDDPGPLGGVPVTVKVTVDQVGFATTNGLRQQRDQIAHSNNPAVDNLRRAGAVILGRTNTPAFSLRWFTSNLLHGRTFNPHDRHLTPGGSSGGAAVSVACGIGHLAHGTDIAGSIRYPAYACGVHGLRPSLGRIPAFNASTPERSIGAQIMAVSGPIARSIADLRAGLHAMAAADPRDPWYVPAPLTGPERPRIAALCTHPDGLATVPEVVQALHQAASALRDAGWRVDEVETVPPLREAAELNVRLWIGDGFSALAESAEREGDPGALAVVAGYREAASRVAPDVLSKTLMRRATLARAWQMFLDRYAVLLLPVSGELPFPDDLDLQGPAAFARVWEAQMPQIGWPLLGLPGLSVATAPVGVVPCGVQVVSARFREDLCMLAGEVIEAASPPVRVVAPAGAGQP